MKYSDFQLSVTVWLEKLNGSLSEFDNLLLLEAKKNERVAKALAMYSLSGQSEFRTLLTFAKKDAFAKQMVVDLYFGLVGTTNESTKTFTLVRLLVKRFFKDDAMRVANSGVPSVYAQEYSKYLTSLVLEYELNNKGSNEAETYAVQMMDKVNMSKLFV